MLSQTKKENIKPTVYRNVYKNIYIYTNMKINKYR